MHLRKSLYAVGNRTSFLCIGSSHLSVWWSSIIVLESKGSTSDIQMWPSKYLHSQTRMNLVCHLASAETHFFGIENKIPWIPHIAVDANRVKLCLASLKAHPGSEYFCVCVFCPYVFLCFGIQDSLKSSHTVGANLVEPCLASLKTHTFRVFLDFCVFCTSVFCVLEFFLNSTNYCWR